MTDMAVTQMMWRPQLICLTLIPGPGLEEGRPTECFVDPSYIVSIRRTLANYQDKGSDEFNVACTLVKLSGGEYIHVIETPAHVAMLRDKMLGYESKLKSA